MDFQPPTVASTIRDAERNVTYTVMAYRALTRPELVQCVRMHMARQRKKPKKGSRITIITTFGFNEP